MSGRTVPEQGPQSREHTYLVPEEVADVGDAVTVYTGTESVDCSMRELQKEQRTESWSAVRD